MSISQSILDASDYYALFSVSPSLVDQDPDCVRRAYKRLALSVHPDKCSEPDAEVAFKKVAKAYSVLSDPRLRQIYDTFGSNEHDESDSVEDMLGQTEALFPGMDTGLATKLLAMMRGYSNMEKSAVCKLTVNEIELVLRKGWDARRAGFVGMYAGLLLWLGSLIYVQL